MHDTGTSSIVYVRYWYYQYCNITILVFLVLYSVTILVLPVLYTSIVNITNTGISSIVQCYNTGITSIVYQYCKYYNTGNTSIAAGCFILSKDVNYIDTKS
jgi:hypothetical protein